MIKAVIFDMDGVLVDSETLGLKAAQIAFAKYGARVKLTDVRLYFGAGTRAYVTAIAKEYRIKKDIDDLIVERFLAYEQLVRRDGLPRKEGAFKLLKKARKMGLKTALATASSFHKVRMNLKAGRIPLKLFDAIVSGTRVRRFKPFPDIFLAAARRLGVSPAECIVIEDAMLGIIAAKRAGMKAVGVVGAFPAKMLKKSGADITVRDNQLSERVGEYLREKT